MSVLQEQFLELVEKNQGIIRKITRLYADNEFDRQDLQQDILLQSWRSFPNFRSESRFSTWLYRVALNTALTYRRRQEKNTVDHDTGVHHTEPDHGDAKEVLWKAIKTLNDIDRMVISLHLDGYPHHEIAEITGINKNNLAVKLNRARQKVIKICQQYGLE